MRKRQGFAGLRSRRSRRSHIPFEETCRAGFRWAANSRDTGRMLTLFGACAVTFMMLMYALEHRHLTFILAFACGCLLSSVYGFLAGTWPFGVVEVIWAAVAVSRYRTARQRVSSVASA